MTMTQPKEAFNQVKAILGKLDRSITEARSRRLGEPIENPEAPPSVVPEVPPIAASAPKIPAPAVQPASGYAARRAQYGRAKPVQPRNDADPKGSWLARD